MKHLMTTAVLAVSVALAGCAADGQGGMTKKTGGTLIGAGIGGLVGSHFGKGSGKLAAVAIGALAGALIGRHVGESLDRADRLAMERTAQNALERNRTGSASTWENPDTGHSGTVKPVKTYKTAHNQYCREYQQTVTIGGKTENAYGTACRQPDGSWKIVK